MKRSFVILAISLVVFLICGAPTITFKAVRPALIDVPGRITSICLIDRSLLPKTTGNILEGGLTAEIFGEDRILSQYSLDGVVEILNGSGRFKVVRTNQSFKKNSAPEMFPDPMAWNEVDKICEEHNVNSLLSLEVFDTDLIIPTKNVRVTVGFRFYDPTERVVLDQNQLTHDFYLEGTATSVISAVNLLADKGRAVRDASYEAGVIYGERLTPSWYSISREYYRKPKKDRNLREGSRMMEVNDWDAAIESLSKAVESNKRKVRGRAAHNLAIVYEILGDFEKAQRWAKDAWGRYENKASKNYSYILSNRIREQQILDEQQKH